MLRQSGVLVLLTCMVTGSAELEIEPRPALFKMKADHLDAFSQLQEREGTLGMLGVLPAVGEIQIDGDDRATSFKRVTASPQVIELAESGVRVEMTSQDAVVAYRFTFPESKECHVLVDVAQVLESFLGGEVRLRDDKTMEGTATYAMRNGQSRDVSFSFQFSKPFRRRGVWEGAKMMDGNNQATAGEKEGLGAFAYFWTHSGETILMKVGIAEGSVDAARAELEKTFPGWDFDQLRAESSKIGR